MYEVFWSFERELCVPVLHVVGESNDINNEMYIIERIVKMSKIVKKYNGKFRYDTPNRANKFNIRVYASILFPTFKDAMDCTKQFIKIVN